MASQRAEPEPQWPVTAEGIAGEAIAVPLVCECRRDGHDREEREQRERRREADHEGYLRSTVERSVTSAASRASASAASHGANSSNAVNSRSPTRLRSWSLIAM